MEGDLSIVTLPEGEDADCAFKFNPRADAGLVGVLRNGDAVLLYFKTGGAPFPTLSRGLETGVGGKFEDGIVFADGLNLGMDDECTLRVGVCGSAVLEGATIETFDVKDGDLDTLA